MIECFYYKNGQKINDIQDIIFEFFKTNYVLKNSAIFSSEEIQNSVVEKLLNIKGAISYEASPKTNVTKFIVEENAGLFNKLGIDSKNGRFAPEVIEENRIYHFVKDNLRKVENLPDTVDISNLKYSQERLTTLLSNNDLQAISENKLILLLAEIEDIMEFEEKTKDFGIFLHEIISLKLQEKEYSNKIYAFLNKPVNKELIGDFKIEEWANKIEEIVDEIENNVKKIGRPISELFLLSDDGSPVDKFGSGIKGKLDLVAVDNVGDVHIFEIKISKTEYKDWDSAKILTLDWQLALYRQLLSQHVNVNNTMLYTIPIWISDVGDPNAVFLEKMKNRKSESKNGLNEGQKLTRISNKLMPRKVIGDFDPERETRLKEYLAKLIDPEYKIETGIEDYDVDKIMENARKRYEREKVWKKYNNFDDIPGIKKGYIESDSEEEFREKIIEYVKHIKGQVNQNVSILKDAIISAIKTNSPISTSAYDGKKDSTVNHLLKEYLNDEWEVIDSIPETLAMGLIILKNRINGNVNIMSLSIAQFYADYGKKLPGKNYGDVEFLKSFLFANEFKDMLFPQGNGKLAQIIVYNPHNSQVYTKTTYNKFNEFSELMNEKGLGDVLKLSLEKDISGVEDVALYNLDANLRKFDGSEKKEINQIFEKFRNADFDHIDVTTLIEVQKDFFDKYPDYKYKTFEGNLNFEDQKEVILALLQVAIVSKSNMELAVDFQRLSKLSLGFSDFKSLFTALYTEDQAKYDKNAKRIQGMVQGLLWTTPDWVASKDLKNINQIMSTSNQHIGEWMVKVSENIYSHTKKYYKAINFGNAERDIIGETQSKHKNLWAQTPSGVVSDEFRTKNPYVDSVENSLEDHERDYLKNMLLIINTWKLELVESDVKKLNVNSLESIMTHPKIKSAIENGEYFRMPLIRREELTRYKDLLTTPAKLWKTRVKPYLNEINDYIDPRELTKEDLEIIEKQKMGFYEMYDVYARQTPEYIARGIEKHSVNYFEWNLDTIAHRVAFNKIRKKIYDKKLPIINAYIWWIKLLAGKENEKISNQLEYIKDQMSLSVFDEPIIDEEFQDFSTVTAVLKRMSTAAMLALKPASLIKEMTIGAFRGITLAATQIYGKDQFTAKDLTAAYQKLMTIDNKFASEFNLIDRLNAYYRFANMDVNTIAKKLQSDRRGLFKGTGRYMYMFNTIPDYYNRLSIFLAKMIHDGSYDAHSLENGEFKYDPTKDARFAHYLSNRDKYLKNGEYTSAPSDAKYNEQRRRYILLISQLNQEYKGERVFTEADLVHKAYSEIERTSLKSFTDMAYGYYDKDAQSQAGNTWWGMTWLQFMQFWPGKMKMWFANKTDESPMGKVIHSFKTDENGNKIYQYHKTIENEDGSITTEPTSENTGDPILQWEGAPYEGLYYSLVGTIRDVVTLDFKHIKNSEERNRRALFALADAGLIFLLLALVKVMLDAMIAENGTEGLAGSLLNMSSSIEKKVLREYNIYESTLGAVNSEPVFLSWGKKMSGDIWDALSGEREITEVMTRNIGAAEVFKW